MTNLIYLMDHILLLTLKTIWNTFLKKHQDKIEDKNSENVPKFESVEVVLMHCNVVKNDYQQASKVIFTFVPNEKLGQLINVSPCSLIMLNTINTNFSFVDVWFTDQKSTPLWNWK